MYTYNQYTGMFVKPDGSILTTCYSGHGDGRNNPMFQNVKDVGPITRGFYKIAGPIDSPKLGPIAMMLNPIVTLLNGRGGFFIHGDNVAHNASDGCIIMDHTSRQWLANNLVVDTLLEVV